MAREFTCGLVAIVIISYYIGFYQYDTFMIFDRHIYTRPLGDIVRIDERFAVFRSIRVDQVSLVQLNLLN